MRAVNWHVYSSLTAGATILKSGTRNKPEQTSSASWCWCILLPHSRDARYEEIPLPEMISAQLGQAQFQVTGFGTAITDHNCHRLWHFHFPSPCANLQGAQGIYPRDCFPNVHARGKVWTASSVLFFTILSSKLYPSFFCHSKWLILLSDLPLIQNDMPVLLCESVRWSCPNPKPNLLWHWRGRESI